MISLIFMASEDDWEEVDGEWTKIELTVESGAVNTVGPPRTAPKVPTVEGEAKRRGVKYRVANGNLIDNLGEKKLRGLSDEYKPVGLTMQVTDVTKPLLSVREMVNAGQRVVFSLDGSYSEDMRTGS